MNENSEPKVFSPKDDPGSLRERLRQYRLPASASAHSPSLIRRCFITGKQCTFCSKLSDAERVNDDTRTNDVERKAGRNNSVFVVMPFRPNLDTVYAWNLRPFIEKALGNKDRNKDAPDLYVQRADQVSKIGYVMCERICKKIQEAALVCVDLSLASPNVFYELGLAVGLGKPLLLVCESAQLTAHTDGLLAAIGINRGWVVPYDGMSYPYGQVELAWGKIKHLQLEEKATSRSLGGIVLPLCVNDAKPARPDKGDIMLGFSSALHRAVAVSLDSVFKKGTDPKRDDGADATRQQDPDFLAALEMIRGDESKTLRVGDVVTLVEEHGLKYATYDQVQKAVASAFCCIVDLANENPVSYFWLGYCHARGINAVPVSRPHQTSTASGGDHPANNMTSTVPTESEKTRSTLAFDIRALWYIEYERERPERLENSLRSVWEDLAVRDLTWLHRSTFWERLTRVPRVSIFTGALHWNEPSREMVGDWDLRTVSELMQYLSSAEVSATPKLELPVYAPRTILQKINRSSGKPITSEALRDEYLGLLGESLAEAGNCLIIATAESNPLTEFALSHAYFSDDKRCFTFDVKGKARLDDDDDGIVVALKASRKDERRKGQRREVERRNDSSRDEFPTFFCRDIGGYLSSKSQDDRERGFLVDKNLAKELYTGQDAFAAAVTKDEKPKFAVLAHLLVMKNPFPKKLGKEHGGETWIVVLNGISGPGTMALAELLTGKPDELLTGRSAEGKNSDEVKQSGLWKSWQAESILKELNTKLQEVEAHSSRGYRGVELVIKVDVAAPPPSSSNDPIVLAVPKARTAPSKAVRMTSYDVRTVTSWKIWVGRGIAGNNPRLIPTISRPPESKVEGPIRSSMDTQQAKS